MQLWHALKIEFIVTVIILYMSLSLDYFIPLWVPFAKNCYMHQCDKTSAKQGSMHVSRNIHSACIFPQSFSVLLYRNFNENPSMQAVANIVRAWASEHLSNFCAQFKQRPNFGSTFKLIGQEHFKDTSPTDEAEGQQQVLVTGNCWRTDAIPKFPPRESQAKM